MQLRPAHSRLVAALAALALFAGTSPVVAGPEPASVSGVIQKVPDRQPLAGARLLAAGPTGTIIRSETTGADGRFALPGLEPASYSLAVESDGGLYIVESPLLLEPGVTRRVDLEIASDVDEADGAGDPAGEVAVKAGPWNNPLTAALIVSGIAVVLGLAVEDATEDDGSPL